MKPIEELLRSYPRVRPPLPPAHQAHYLNEYRINRNGSTCATGLAAKAESWMHRKIAARRSGGRILELGAGTLNHVPYESAFTVYDFVEPFEDLWSGNPLLPRTSAHFPDIREVPPGNLY